ncbi:MAG TPA: tetratricopeptide repeat protein [Kofleriaceae bacterium]|jgi:hypothetical protein|nr:tetratricopeptide repeat protein [Kofleriaceae bacterium]
MRGWLIVAAVTLATPVRADTPADKAAKLFEQGRELVAHGDYKRAYDVFSQSYELDRAVGTELNLADCLEHMDQPAKAIDLYRDAAKQLDAIGKAPQAKFARDRIDALAPRVATINIVLKPRLPETTVKIGGRDIAVSDSISVQVDPGNYDVVIAAPGATTFTKNVIEPAGGTDTMTVSLPPIAVAPASGARDPQRVWIALGVGGAGVVAVAASSIAIIVAHRDYTSTKADPNYCTSDDSCTLDGLDKISHAQHIADVSTGLFIVGAALVAAGGVLWYTAPREHVTVAPMATATSAGVSVFGRF